MPTYEYECAKCGHRFEKVQTMSTPALKICPKEDCGMKKWGKGKVTRAIGAGAGLIFKGSGFYITDYRSENYKAGAKNDAPATTSTASDAKPAAASQGKPAESKPAPAPAPTPAPAKSESKPATKKAAK
jgi:putative FmdB family regulatory protein